MKSQFETRTSCTDDAGEITVLKCESIPKRGRQNGRQADRPKISVNEIIKTFFFLDWSVY